VKQLPQLLIGGDQVEGLRFAGAVAPAVLAPRRLAQDIEADGIHGDVRLALDVVADLSRVSSSRSACSYVLALNP